MKTSCAACYLSPELTCRKAAGLLLSISDLDGVDVEDNEAAPAPDSDRNSHPGLICCMAGMDKCLRDSQ